MRYDVRLRLEDPLPAEFLPIYPGALKFVLHFLTHFVKEMAFNAKSGIYAENLSKEF